MINVLCYTGSGPECSLLILYQKLLNRGWTLKKKLSFEVCTEGVLMTSQWSQVNSLTVCGPKVDTLICCQRRKLPSLKTLVYTFLAKVSEGRDTLLKSPSQK